MRVVFSKMFDAELDDLHDYIEEHGGARAAERIADGIVGRCESLARFPEQEILLYRVNGDALGFRMARFEHWRILYSITGDAVRITRLLDTRSKEYQLVVSDELSR